MKRQIPYFFALTIVIILLLSLCSCKEKGIEPEIDMICVYKLRPLKCTQAIGCPPRRTFETCDEKINAFRYDLDLYEIEDCGRCE